MNGDFSGPLGTKFEINGRILDVVKIETADNQMLVVSSDNRVVISANGKFESNNPVVIIKVATDAKNITLSNIRFNDNNTGDINVGLSTENNDLSGSIITVSPNVVTDKAFINVSIVNDGYYELNVYDLQGNMIYTIASGDMKANNYLFSWDAKNMSGSSVSNGMYVYRLSGAGVNVSGKMIVNK